MLSSSSPLQPNQRRSHLSELLSGALASGIITTIQTPYERLRLVTDFLQRVTHLKEQKKPLWREFRSLWKGNFRNLRQFVPRQALNFPLYSYFSQQIPTTASLPSTARYHSRLLTDAALRFAAGASAGIIGLIVFYPFMNARSVLQQRSKDTPRYRSIMQYLVSTTKEHGFRGVYSGLKLAIPGVGIYRGFFFGGYDFCKRTFLRSRTEQERLSSSTSDRVKIFMQRWFMAGSTSLVGVFLSRPFDMLRRFSSLNKAYRLDLERVISEHGVAWLFKGVPFTRPVLLSLALPVYDLLQRDL